MSITEKVAYLKGLAEGMKLKESDEATLLNKIIDVLEDLADELDLVEEDVAEIAEQVDAIDEDLEDLEDDFYELDDDCDCDCDCDDDDDEYYEVTCPTCGDTIYLDEDLLLAGGIECPNCGEELEFEIPECDCEECKGEDEED
jgi:DNA-directed RNA polymerase subunit RPC12/RpoP